MAGSNQAVNLSGMLNQIAGTLGQGYDSVGDHIASNISRIGPRGNPCLPACTIGSSRPPAPR